METYHAVVHKKDASSDGYHGLYAESERYGLEEFDSRRLYKRLPDQARIRIRKHISPLGTVVHYGDIEETPQPKVSDDLLL